MMMCQNLFVFMMKLLIFELFTKNIKIGRTYKESLEDTKALVENSEITKNHDDLKLVV